MMSSKKGWLAAGLFAMSMSIGWGVQADEQPAPPETANEVAQMPQASADEAPATPAEETAAPANPAAADQ